MKMPTLEFEDEVREMVLIQEGEPDCLEKRLRVIQASNLARDLVPLLRKVRLWHPKGTVNDACDPSCDACQIERRILQVEEDDR